MILVTTRSVAARKHQPPSSFRRSAAERPSGDAERRRQESPPGTPGPILVPALCGGTPNSDDAERRDQK